MGGKASRSKGLRREREAARLLGAERVPLSGAAGGSFASDLLLPCGWRVECKARADGFRTLYAWLGGADVLALKADRQPWLAVLPLDRLAALLAAAGVQDGQAHGAGDDNISR